MKKISTLIAMATLATLGSVYATWTYSNQGKLTSDFYLDGATNVGITDKVGAEKGTLAINRDNFSIVIDDANNDHVAEYNITGDIVITYTPSLAISNAEKKNGLNLVFKMSSSIAQYEGVNIFSCCTEDAGHAITNVVANGVDPETGFATTFTYTISAAEIDKVISFYTNTFSEDEATDDGELVLDTETKYDAFKEALHNGALKITISEA